MSAKVNTTQEGHRKVRTLLVDDHPITRLGLRSLLETTEDLRVVGEAGGAEEAVRLAVRLRPDLIVLDLRLGGEGDGAEVCREAKALSDPPRILVHTAHGRTADLAAVAVAGADGYFHKGADYLEFPGVIRRIFSGERVWFASEQTEPQMVGRTASKGPALTPREHEVFALMLRRYSNAEVGSTLYMSLPTVKTHVKHILGKMGLKSRKELFRPAAGLTAARRGGRVRR